MKVEITLQAYMFPMLLSVFKMLHIQPLVKWWRIVSKRHFSYAKVSKGRSPDFVFSINLKSLAIFVRYPKQEMKNFIFFWKFIFFRLPFRMARLPFTWLDRKFIEFMLPRFVHYMERNDISLEEQERVLRFTPYGLREAWDAYVNDKNRPSEGYVGPCYCDACVLGRNWISAVTIYEAGYDVKWANELVAKYPGGEDLPACEINQSGPRPEDRKGLADYWYKQVKVG